MDLLSTLIGRAADLDEIYLHASRGQSYSLVGVSNTGKSALLRHLCDVPSAQGTFVYADCNQMGERTARAFFSSTWRSMNSVIQAQALSDEIKTRAKAMYDEMVHAASSEFVVKHFDEGIALALEHLPRPLVLCLDEFDEAYQHLEPQAFLHLRSLKDRYGDALAFVVATERELEHLTKSREQGEFFELVAPHRSFLHFMEPADTREFCRRYAAHEGVTFSEADFAFIRENADGHPGLVQAVCFGLGAVTGAPTRDAPQDGVIHQIVQRDLAADANVQSECAKIWDDLDEMERDALLHLSRIDDESSTALRTLRAKFIVRDGDSGPVVFSRLFADYIRQQQFKSHPQTRGVYIDVDASAVFVDGKSIESLTDLEYRLLLFLYGRIDRVCDKYTIVESVWGEDYIDKVDDARIEKLVSRVRQKIEPDMAKPRYLVSVRGRGYKLVR
jgi:hypothetical protein